MANSRRDRRQQGRRPAEAVAKALLSVTVCDPACGSGHFLVAAARRIAKRVAAVREHNPEPSLDAFRHALRDVVANCVYGVDLNPMAVELAKVSLWMEAAGARARRCPSLTPTSSKATASSARPRSSSTAASRRARSRPSRATTEVREIPGTGQQRRAVADRRTAARRPVLERGPHPAWHRPAASRAVQRRDHLLPVQRALAAALEEITHLPDGTLREVHEQAPSTRGGRTPPAYLRARQVADAWCAAFIWLKRATTEDGTRDVPPAIVNRVFTALSERGPAAIPPATVTEIERLREEY